LSFTHALRSRLYERANPINQTDLSPNNFPWSQHNVLIYSNASLLLTKIEDTVSWERNESARVSPAHMTKQDDIDLSPKIYVVKQCVALDVKLPTSERQIAV
jgi:hypothetical protein